MDEHKPHVHWVLRIGAALTVVALALGLVFYLLLPETLARALVQVALVLGIVGGSTLFTIGLHSSGRIGRETLDRTTLALAVGAILFAVWQFGDSRFQEARMQMLSARMQRLSEQMSTRYIGIFPKNMKDINELLNATDNHFDIMSDFVGYGHYSWPEQFDIYKNELLRLRHYQHIPVRMLVYTREKGAEVHNTQFTKAAFEKAIRGPDRKLLSFCENYNGGQLPSSKEAFDELLFRKQRDYMHDLREACVQIRVTDHELPFFLWNEDDQEAVVSFLNEDLPDAREVSFRTRDQALIVNTFKLRYNKLWNEAKKAEILSDTWKPASGNSVLGDRCPGE